jgi:TRAP-type C4-dicarboxylate transport system permease small subunit
MSAQPPDPPTPSAPPVATIWLYRLGGFALLFAMATDAVAVLGRHLGIPLLGSIEMVQAAMLVASSTAVVAATLAEKHAVVHLLVGRLRPATQGKLARLHSLLCCVFFAALTYGSVWIALDLHGGHEESELLHIPYAPLRVICILAMLAVALIFVTRSRRQPSP